MIIKLIDIKSNNPPKKSWILFDNCQEVSYESQPQYVPGFSNVFGSEQMRAIEAAFGIADNYHLYIDGDLVTKPGSPDNFRVVRWIRWMGADNLDPTLYASHLLVTDHQPVYLLTDAGDTIERI